MESEINEIEIWKIKRMINNIENLRGNGTSMISLILPKGENLDKTKSMLVTELGTASNIKSRVNKLSVLSAIVSTQHKLKTYNHTPKNGLVIFCGTVVNDQGKEKKITIDFEPFKPLSRYLYMCDSKFHTDDLRDLLISNEKYGFIVMDGNGVLYASLCGEAKQYLNKYTVELPKKHKKGGQSSVRFARLRVEARDRYTKKCGEMAISSFITNDLPNVNGLILAGSADFKDELEKVLDPRLKKIVLDKVDISYGMDLGLNQAIENSKEVLSNVKFIKEKKVIQEFFHHINVDDGLYCFGINETLNSYDAGAIEKIIIWENIDLTRFVLYDRDSETNIIKVLSTKEIDDTANFINDNNNDLDIVERENYVDWLAQNYQGTKLEIISDSSAEASQFIKGFGGFGGILRWKLDTQLMNNLDEEASDDDEWI